MNSKQRLELDWVGKDADVNLEPRILIKDESLSFGDGISENLLIHGDNLLALKALESNFKETIKCIFIDPPYNTGKAFEHYDDGIEHSIWLSLIRDRLVILKKLLAPDGTIWISIDDNESHYLKVLMDEIFGRNCFVSNVIWRSTDNSNNDAKQFSVDHNHILVYSKEPGWLSNRLERTDDQSGHYSNPDNDPKGPWFDGNPISSPNPRDNLRYEITTPSGKIIKPPRNGWRWSRETLAERMGTGEIRFNTNETNIIRRTYLKDQEGLPPSTLWADLDITGHNRQAKYEQKKLFPDLPTSELFSTPKPEKLLHYILKIATKEGDWVMDSFAGSGTTGAVSHKMKRRWIMVEMGDHIHQFIVPRLNKIISGADVGGVTNLCAWNKGGGYSFLNLAPSLLQKDEKGNWIINDNYNALQLAEAVCKHEKFKFHPHDSSYWKQGYSSENDFIFVTTQFLTSEHLDHIQTQMKKNETLLICAKAFRINKDKYPNISLKKIPQMLLGRCEFGRDDYSLNVKEIVQEELDLN